MSSSAHLPIPDFGDPLSEALTLSEARSVITGGFRATAPWALQFWPQARLKLAAVVSGSCWLTTDGPQPPLLLGAGDVAVLNDVKSVQLTSDPGLAPVEAAPMFGPGRETIVRITSHHQEHGPAPTEETKIPGGPSTVIIGGHVVLNATGEELLLSALPPLTRISAESAEAPVVQWILDRLLHELAAERPGTHHAAHQYAQLLLVEVLRSTLAASPESFPTGWLRALADPRLAPALRRMHAEPGRRWHLEELAQAAAMSRTNFSTRFRAAAGVPPLTYLHHWRMRIAERGLFHDETLISSLASSLGYASESAFSNAFKRTYGCSPRTYRAQIQARQQSETLTIPDSQSASSAAT
ncbi:AraC family transcriptional regulator [Planotetraspora thailandica]|uniref:AraC family transcriptional regulator n=1 Tax=Planotetraspora thailandica TaxID=487172 RepID=A0A8J3Y2S5_9ACTN|nr:AraC family transcriptional regulator [Planotetraspora thailandica]GII59870.1 AraC family transcriptional regulator [Planotetraspora thailandica]